LHAGRLLGWEEPDMTTLEVVPNSENLRDMSEVEAARELVQMAREQGLSLTALTGC
jgi:putative transposase